jgi:hypothetical protein
MGTLGITLNPILEKVHLTTVGKLPMDHQKAHLHLLGNKIASVLLNPIETPHLHLPVRLSRSLREYCRSFVDLQVERHYLLNMNNSGNSVVQLVKHLLCLGENENVTIKGKWARKVGLMDLP